MIRRINNRLARFPVWVSAGLLAASVAAFSVAVVAQEHRATAEQQRAAAKAEALASADVCSVRSTFRLPSTSACSISGLIR